MREEGHFTHGGCLFMAIHSIEIFHALISKNIVTQIDNERV